VRVAPFAGCLEFAFGSAAVAKYDAKGNRQGRHHQCRVLHVPVPLIALPLCSTTACYIGKLAMDRDARHCPLGKSQTSEHYPLELTRSP
jgi:hypothetical protein